MAKIVEISGRSGYYLRVPVPRGYLREFYGTCDVVKKLGKNKKEAEANAHIVEKEIKTKFEDKLKEMERKKDAASFGINEINTKQNSNETVNVKSIHCVANQSPLTKFEQFKCDSQYLDIPLREELKNDSDHFTNDAVQLLKFHGSYQQDDREHKKKGGKGKDWQMMLRLRNPAGHVPGALYIALDELSDKLGNGTLRATTRQCFQMHGIRKEKLKVVIGTIIKTLGSTLGACGDINRNVMAPAAPFSGNGYPAARKLACEIADLLAPSAAEKTYLDLWVDGDLSYRIKPSVDITKARTNQMKSKIFSGDINEPLYGATYMPRKFKCAVTVPGDNSVDILTHDIGLVAITNSKGMLQGCNVYVGGGMGRTHNLEATFARPADPLGYVKAEDIFELIQSILALQRDYGDRKTRRHSRMKYLIHDMGIDWFREELKSKYFRKSLAKFRSEKGFQLKDYLGWHQQSKGLFFVGIPLLSGRLSGDVKKGIREIIEKFKLDIQLTPNQDLLLCNIGKYQKKSVEIELEKLGISDPGSPPILERHALACPALPLCGLAMTEAERSLPEILNRIYLLLTKLGISKSILIRITGCPNGCARPYMAELALVGSGLNQYQLWLGGSPNLERLAKPYLQKMKITDLEETLIPLFKAWKRKINLSFGDYVNQLDNQTIVELLSIEAKP